MTHTNDFTTSARKPLSLTKAMLYGAATGFVIISIFVFGAQADPSWPAFWQVKPLLVTPAAGALAGALFFLVDYKRFGETGLRVFALVYTIIGCAIMLWIGTVLGLNGTMWD